MAAAHYKTIAHLRELVAKVGLTIPPPGPPKRPPVEWMAVSCALTALFLAACLSRRARAWLRMRPRLSRPSRCGETYLEAFTLRVVVASLGVCVVAFVWRWTPLHYVGMLGSAIAIVYVFARCHSIRIPVAEWGWRRGRGIWRELLIGVLVGLIFTLLRYLPGAAVERFDATLPLGVNSFRILKSVIWASVVEETLYRGMLYRYLRDRCQWPLAVLVTAAVFVAMHFPLWRWQTFAAGIVFALLREWRGSLLAPIAAHAMGNALIVFVRSGGFA